MEELREEGARLARGGSRPAYVDHPKQFLQQNVFRAHQLVPTYAVHEWPHAQPTTFAATVAVPWLIDEGCTCEHSRRARVAQLEPDLVGDSASAAHRLWMQILQPSQGTIEPGSATCFCRVAFGYGLASTRKEAERMAAADVAKKLHSAGLLDNLYLEGVAKMAEREDYEPLPNELGWYASDPKTAVVNFAVSRSLNLCFQLEMAEADGRPIATATITLPDGTRVLTQGTGQSRKIAERAAALLLCEHPGILPHLRQPHRPKRKSTPLAGAPLPFRNSVHAYTADDGRSSDTAQAVTTMEDESDDEEIHVLAPSDPGATHVPVVVPDTLENPSRASRQTRFASADVLSCAFPSTGARRLNKVPSPHNPGLQPVAGRSSTVAPACAISTEWYAHNPKLYLTRYSEQHALQIDWERGTRGPEHGKEFCTTVRVPLPGMLAEPLCETAWARTKREAEGTAATAMCRKLSAMGLMDEPQQQKTRRSANTKRLKGAVAPSERSGSPIASLSGMRVRLPGAGALKMRTPHMKGLVECNHAHRLPEPAQLVLSKNLDDCLAELEHLDAPSVSPIPTEIAEDSAGAFAEHYHGDPTLSPTVDSSQWRSEVPDAAGEDDSAGQARLSIFASKGAILQAIRTSQVVLVSGPSGSGKSTQLCQYIMDDWQAAGFANKCSIVHCFPGSLVAESVASRVAAERCTSIGTCVGYHTHLSHRIPSLGKDGARVVFTTTATLMHRLQYDPFLADVTHILVDEVDSRTIQIDIILTYMRILLPRRDSLRLVVIAAGDQTNCRACVRDYFSQLVCVDVAGPLAGAVRACFLEEVLQLTQPDADARRLEAAIHRLDEETAVDLSLVTAVVAHIITTSVDGGILIFLPSAEMVEALCKTLSAAAPYSDASRFCITPLHATGTVDTVKRVYKPVDPGVRKIVISTSIAERELPVDDIGYVIDSGRTQERTYVSQTAMTFFGLTFATREECQRRRTRAAGGRDGCYFCLLSTSRAAALQSQKQPEMKRMPLAEAILLVQNLQMGNIKQFMSLTPDPPPPTAVSEAVLRLHEIGALTRETDALTPLGGQLAKLSCVCNPRIGKLLIIGTLFGVRDDALTIAAALCVRPILTLPSEGERAQAAAVHQTLSDGSFSDHHCVLRAYSQWVRVRQESGEAGATEFATAHYLSETNLQALDCIRPVLDQALAATGVVALPAATAARAEELRTGSQHIMGPLLRAAITSSLMSTVLQVKQRSGGRPGFCTQDNCRMVLHPSSVNAHRIHAELPARWLVFSSPVQHQSHILVRETTVASSAAMVVLSHGELWERVDTPTGAEIVVGDWIRFVCPVVGTFDRVRALREHVGVALAQVLSRSDSSATGEYVDRVFAAAFQFLREGLGAGGVALSPGGPGAAGGM